MPFKQTVGHQNADGGSIKNVQGKYVGGERPEDDKDDIDFQQDIGSQVSTNGGSVVNISGLHVHNNSITHHDTLERTATASSEGADVHVAHGQGAASDTSNTEAHEQAKLEKLRHLKAQEANDVLTRNLTYLCENINNVELLHKFKEKGGIRSVPLSIIKAKEVPYFQNIALIDYLEKSGAVVFVKFIDSLLETDQKSVALQLAESLK
uniref:Uncharacterized protein n=1 Tax=Plectus sambesii TaxID=2011161 RepID=A0A914X3V9_9BILA